MDQSTIDNDKAQLAQAKADVESASQRVVALTKQLADDERALEKQSIIQALEMHAGTLESTLGDEIRNLAARVNALI